MKIIPLIALLFSFVCLKAADSYSRKSFSKQDFVQFLRPIIGQKINTKDFDVLIEKMPTEDFAENASLENANIDELVIDCKINYGYSLCRLYILQL